MSIYSRFLEDGGYCRELKCHYSGYDYPGYGYPEYNQPGYGFSGYVGCLCHCCNIRTRCKWWRRRFR